MYILIFIFFTYFPNIKYLLVNYQLMMSFYMFGILQVKHHKAMWCNSRKYRIKKLDETKKTYDSGIIVVFEVTNVSSRSERHPELSEN